MNLKIILITALINLIVLGMIFLWTYNSGIYLAELAAITCLIIAVPLISLASAFILRLTKFKKEALLFLKVTFVTTWIVFLFWLWVFF